MIKHLPQFSSQPLCRLVNGFTGALCVLALLPAIATARNEVEPNDAILDAELLSSGTEIVGSLETHEDVDWFAVEITGKASIQIEMSLANFTGDRESPNSSSEWEVTFYDDEGNVYERFNDRLFDPVTFSISSPGEGFIYFAVRSSGFFWDEEYAFTVTVNTADTTYGDFSGLWQTTEGQILSIHQERNTAIIGMLYTDGNNWEGHAADIDENVLSSRTIHGLVDAQYEIVLLAPGVIAITQISCTPVSDATACRYPDGTTFTANRIIR